MRMLVLICSLFLFLPSCASYAKKQAVNKGIKTAGLKSGESCKYIGFIGSDSVEDAKKKGGVKIVMYKNTDGNFLKKCTTVYGK